MPDDGSPGGQVTPATAQPAWADVQAWFAGHGFWRLDLRSGELEWADSLFEQGDTRQIETADQDLILEAIHPEDRPHFQAALQSVAVQRKQATLAIRVRREGAAWRVVSIQMSPELGAGAEVVAVRGAIIDVTEIEICRILAQQGNDIITQTDTDGVITFISASVEAVTGYHPSELMGQPVSVLVGDDGAAALRAAVRRIIDDPSSPDRAVEYRARRKDGEEIWLESRLIPIASPGSHKAASVTEVIREITARKAAEDKLAKVNHVVSALVEATPDAILLVDEAWRITAFNHRFVEMWGIDEEILAAGDYRPVLELWLAQVRDDSNAAARITEITDAADQDSFDEIETLDGRWISRHSAPVHAADGAVLGRAWYFRDVTEHKRALHEAVRMSRFDHLTGLANRTVLLEALDRAILQSRRRDVAFAIFYLDLDDFKDVNDTLGHAVGDQLLMAVAERLRTRVRDTDVVARIGGDEFAILVSDLRGATDAALLADEIIKVLSDPYQLGETVLYTSACVGIDLFGPEASDGRTLLSHADIALYQAKSAGAGAYRFFTEAMDGEVRTRVSLGAELREAIDAGQLFLLYQPAVELRTGAIVGVEALVRWNHPKRGMLPPDLFVPVAEQMGLIGAMGRWVLWTAARQLRSWIDEGLPPLRMGVNVSALQFKTPAALEADIGAVLAATCLAPNQIELELTESALMTASEGGDVLLRLADRGIQIAIDDFGTGYSSLDYLRRFPASRIKIAQTFVGNLGSRSGDAAIVKATISLARELGMTVIAEGIETDQQARMLTDWGCPEGQGYLFDRPLNPYALGMRLRAGGYRSFGSVELQKTGDV